MDLRGRSERIVSVASDGARTRYQQRLGYLSRNRVGALHQLGWYRRLMKSCPKEIWDRTFFYFFRKGMRKMYVGGIRWRWRPLRTLPRKNLPNNEKGV